MSESIDEFKEDVRKGHNGSFHFYSWGIAAANKKRKSDKLEITPTQDFPFTDDEVSSHVKKINSKGIDSSGNSFETEVKATVTLSATWMPLGQSNRLTSPDVRRGELVAIYRFSDQDFYYWITAAKAKKIRRTETVIYAFGATKEENVELDANNSYFIEISGHDGHLTVRTSKANGELATYTFQLNGKDGLATLRDNIGSQINIDTQKRLIEVIHPSTNSIILSDVAIAHNAPIHIFNGNMTCNGNIFATGTIIDVAGNTNHHGH